MSGAEGGIAQTGWLGMACCLEAKKGTMPWKGSEIGDVSDTGCDECVEVPMVGEGMDAINVVGYGDDEEQQEEEESK